MALAQVSNQLLRSQGNDTTTVATNYPITGDGSTQLPLGLAEDYRGADGESLTFNITDITDGHRVTISGIQGSYSFDVLDGQDGANGVNGVNGADGQSVTFDITNIASGHRVTLSGAQGSASFDVMNGQDGVDGVSPTFRFSESEDGVTVFVSGAQGEESFRLYNGTSGNTYSAGPNIDIYPVDDQLYISAKDWTSTIESAVSSKMDKSASGNFYPMTGNPSGFLTAVDLSNYYQKTETSSKEEISAALTSKLDKSESGNFYPMTGNPSGFLTAHQDLTNLPYVQNSALGYTPSMYISSISGHELYAESANHAFTAETANYVEGGWEYDENNNISSYNGSAFVGQNQATCDVKASSNINVATAGNTFTVSGKDWSTEISNASTAGSAAVTAWVENQNYLTAHQSLVGLMSASKLEYDSNNKISGYDGSAFAGESRETIPVRGDNGISVTEINNDVVIEISSVAHDATISGNGTVESPLGVIGGGSTTEYSAGANINITNHVISSKNWTNDITAASSYAYSQATADAQGHTYTGVAPIVVNNTEDKISANCIELSAGNGIDSNKLATGVIEVSGGLGGGVAISGEYDLNGSTITADCSAFGMYEQANSPGSYQLMATAYNNTGWHGYGYTMSNSETVLMNNVSSIAQNYAASAVSSHVVPMAYADITYSGVRNVIFNNGIVIPYETTQGYGTFYDFVGSSVADSTSSFIFRHIQTNGYCTTLTVSSYNYGATTGKDKSQSRIFLSPSACECKVVVVATSGDIPSSGATDGKLYVVTGT